MQFNPANEVIKLCLQGMALEEQNRPEEAANAFLQAWNTATNDFERYLAAYYVARHQKQLSDKLQWSETALQFALSINDVAVRSALPALYTNIGRCYEELGDMSNAKKHRELAVASSTSVADDGPFYHGTKAHLQVGDLLTAGFGSNYKDDLTMNHIYFTAGMHGAGLAAALAKGDGRERVYIVEPMGSFENDPNVTDKKFPGNPTRSYRTKEPLKIIGEVADWTRQTPEEIQQWRERLAKNEGEIIN